MSRSKRIAQFCLLLFGLVLLLTGCFGGGLKPKAPPAAVMHGQVFGPPGVQVASAEVPTSSTTIASRTGLLAGWFTGFRVLAATGNQLAGESSLANVPVLIYELADYLRDPNIEPLALTTTDGNGKYSVSGIPSGKDLLVVTGSTPRLSAILPNADHNSSADVNSVTSLATEAWVERLRSDATMAIDAGLLRDTMNAVRNALTSLDDVDLLAALTALVPARLGDGWPSDLGRNGKRWPKESTTPFRQDPWHAGTLSYSKQQALPLPS